MVVFMSIILQFVVKIYNDIGVARNCGRLLTCFNRRTDLSIRQVVDEIELIIINSDFFDLIMCCHFDLTNNIILV